MSKSPVVSTESWSANRAQFPAGAPNRVLVVEDEPDLAWGIRLNLEVEGYQVAVAATGAQALELHPAFQPDLILLDLKLPDIFGLEVLRTIRSLDPAVRVIIVSCLVEPEHRVAGLNAGDNDYQIKPFALPELLMRVRDQFEHVRPLSPFELMRGPGSENRDPDRLVLDPVNRTVLFRSKVIQLAHKPFALLSRLVAAAGDCVSRDDLLREVWHFRHLPETHTVEQHVASLRRELRTDPDAPDVIITVYARGYRIDPTVLGNT